MQFCKIQPPGNGHPINLQSEIQEKPLKIMENHSMYRYCNRVFSLSSLSAFSKIVFLSFFNFELLSLGKICNDRHHL